MFLLKTGWLLLALCCCVKAELWQLPTAVDIQKSLEVCQMQDLSFLDVRRNGKTYFNDSTTDIRCFTTELGLWSDEEGGFNAKRFVQLLSKHKRPEEMRLVISHCNERHKQTDLAKWANQAFYCFASGRMGAWITQYVKHVYKTKNLAHK